MSVAARYAQAEAGDRPVKVCAEAGRKFVRNIFQYPILSAEWVSLVDSLRQLLRLVELEGRMPLNNKVSEVHGRKNDSEGTLWDQQVHENAIRILVEEAKVNLCLRMIHDFKMWSYDEYRREEDLKKAAAALAVDEAQMQEKCEQYEEGLGVLLQRALYHREALQLMDIPLLLDHVALVLAQCKVDPSLRSDVDTCQELCVLCYFSSLMKHSEALNSSELVARMREIGMVGLVGDHVQMHFRSYTPQLSFIVAEGLSAMADNEDFSAQWEDFFQDVEAKQAFLEIEGKLVSPLLEEKPERRREIRPLLDFFGKLRRSLK